jgi:hypothetical protein
MKVPTSVVSTVLTSPACCNGVCATRLSTWSWSIFPNFIRAWVCISASWQCYGFWHAVNTKEICCFESLVVVIFCDVPRIEGTSWSMSFQSTLVDFDSGVRPLEDMKILSNPKLSGVRSRAKLHCAHRIQEKLRRLCRTCVCTYVRSSSIWLSLGLRACIAALRCEQRFTNIRQSYIRQNIRQSYALLQHVHPSWHISTVQSKGKPYPVTPVAAAPHPRPASRLI